MCRLIGRRMVSGEPRYRKTYSRLRECWFVFEGDVTVVILAEELRRVVVGGPEYDGSKWGPFNIDPNQRTVDGRRSYRPDASFGLARSSRGRSI